MIQYKDSMVNTSLFSKMLNKISRIVAGTEKSCLVYMENQNGTPIEVKVLFSLSHVAKEIEDNNYSGEAISHLFSYYIGEI